MFYYISGEAVHKENNFVVIDVFGVGYKVYTSLFSLDKISAGNKVTMYTHLYLREGIMDIYGFLTNEELNVFVNLISVNGIGPKAALSLLSITTIDKFILAVMTNDAKTLTKADGVGTKTAQRVILELKDKMKDKMSKLPESISAHDFAAAPGSVKDDAVVALLSLGYSPEDAKTAIYGLDDRMPLEDMIKTALKNMIK
ncbi:MAG: Holliday junction branch migration protein RuvA [Oscillospiraceae bacterium]|nr:Holliday junction branch migration protein RuvA [Oscillospiraceae bacterium]